MIRLPLVNIHKMFKFVTLAVLVISIVSSSLFAGDVLAAVAPKVSVQIGSEQGDTVKLDSGGQGMALVFLDCGDYVFKTGSVKMIVDSAVFTNVAVKSDADIITGVDVGGDITTVKFSFDVSAGLKGTVQLGTVSFELKASEADSVKSDIKLSEIKLVDNNGNTHTDDVGIKNITVAVENKNVSGTLAPNATPGAQTVAPSATAGNSGVGAATPKPTNKTEILTDTAMYTLEDVEDLSNGAIVFWGLVFMVVGIWIGLGLGYWIWCKRKSKPQVKDTHGNVIGHLK